MRPCARGYGMKAFLVSFLLGVWLIACTTQATPTPLPTVIPTLAPALEPTTLPWSPSTLQSAILEPHGYVSPVHDPVLTKAGDTYYVFSTGAGIPIRCSKDMREWEYCKQVFKNFYPDWVKRAVPGVGD